MTGRWRSLVVARNADLAGKNTYTGRPQSAGNACAVDGLNFELQRRVYRHRRNLRHLTNDSRRFNPDARRFRARSAGASSSRANAHHRERLDLQRRDHRWRIGGGTGGSLVMRRTQTLAGTNNTTPDTRSTPRDAEGRATDAFSPSAR